MIVTTLLQALIALSLWRTLMVMMSAWDSLNIWQMVAAGVVMFGQRMMMPLIVESCRSVVHSMKQKNDCGVSVKLFIAIWDSLMANDNNQIYRFLKTAYRISDKELVDMWHEAGYEKIREWHAKRYHRSDDHRDYIDLASRRLRAWLRVLLDRRQLDVPGISLNLMIEALAKEAEVTPSGDNVKDAMAIRDKLRSDF